MLVNKLSKLIGRRTISTYIILLFKKTSQCFTLKNLEKIILDDFHFTSLSISMNKNHLVLRLLIVGFFHGL